MCVLMGPEVIIKNAFFAKQNEAQYFLEIQAIRRFCNILYNKITGNNNSGISYKYVRFQVDEPDVISFCDDNKQFIRGIDKLYCTDIVTEMAIQQTNSKYSQDVQAILEEAREAFALT